MLPEPHLVKVLLKDPKTQTAQPQDIALMLPHMIFSFLSDNYTECFEEIFAVKECASFWKSVENMKDPRLVKPITLTKGKVLNPEKTIPVFIRVPDQGLVDDLELGKPVVKGCKPLQSHLAYSSA